MYSYVLVRVNINTQTIRKGRKSTSPPGASPFGFWYPVDWRNLRVCLNFIRPRWNGWNGTRLFVVVRTIPSCFQFSGVCVHSNYKKKKAGIAANSVRTVTFWIVNRKRSVQL